MLLGNLDKPIRQEPTLTKKNKKQKDPRLLTFWRQPPRFHGKEELKEGGRYKVTMQLDQKLYYLARLEITNVTKSDKGEYRAVAKNKIGVGTATINLNFQGDDKPK